VLDLIHLSDHPDYPFLIARRDEVIRKSVRLRGEWESGFANYVASLLPRAPRIVIGGGHVGLIAFELWRARPDTVEIVEFEPDSVNSALLSMNVMSWGESPVRVLPVALGARTNIINLAQNPINTGDNRLWDAIPDELDAGGGDPARWPRQPVVCVALDDIWGDTPLDLILLDTQGWEPDVLRGAEHLLRSRRPLAVFEWWPRALTARGIDLEACLSWLERDLDLTIAIAPAEASGLSNPSIYPAVGESDIRRLTELLLEDPDPNAYAELVARPRTET
jgi:FkbM family methyltransferase